MRTKWLVTLVIGVALSILSCQEYAIRACSRVANDVAPEEKADVIKTCLKAIGKEKTDD